LSIFAALTYRDDDEEDDEEEEEIDYEKTKAEFKDFIDDDVDDDDEVDSDAGANEKTSGI
jgi:hypothetical protein